MRKILFIYSVLDSGGAERVLLDLFSNIDYKTTKVDLLLVNGVGVLLDEVPKDVTIIKVWNGYPLSFRLALKCSTFFGIDYLLRQKIFKALENNRYDVAISFLEGLPTKIHSLMMNYADRNYSWVHCDLDMFRYEACLFHGDSEFEIYNKMDAVICVAQDTEEAFHRRFPNITSPTKVIYNPIDIAKIKRMALELDLDNDKFTVAVCGRLTFPKKLDRVLRVARLAKDRKLSIKFQLIGGGELMDELKNLAHQLDVLDMVEFVGYVRNPYPYIKAADVLLSTSMAEGFSLVLCEAMALGVPVISTKTAGPMEIIDDNLYGLLCNHDDESIFHVVCKMYDNAELRHYYRAQGVERVKQYTVANTVNELSLL